MLEKVFESNQAKRIWFLSNHCCEVVKAMSNIKSNQLSLEINMDQAIIEKLYFNEDGKTNFEQVVKSIWSKMPISVGPDRAFLIITIPAN